MKTEAEVGGMNPQPRNDKDFQQPPEAGRKHGMVSPSEPPGGTNPDSILLSSF